MVLIKSISGVRGTVDPLYWGPEIDNVGRSGPAVRFCIWQFMKCINMEFPNRKDFKDGNSIVIGRDGRSTGKAIFDYIANLLSKHCDINVIDLGLTTTPSVQLAIQQYKCLGGIMVSASHNPVNWNGLKLLNLKGEFLSPEESSKVFSQTHDDGALFPDPTLSKIASSLWNDVKIRAGTINTRIHQCDFLKSHINSILDLDYVHVDKIKKQKLVVIVDGINSSGAVYVPALLESLGVTVELVLNDRPNGHFAHNPEPTPENLIELSNVVKERGAHLGIAIDPDVDRLVLVCEDGSFFGEEYTIVAVVKYILSKLSPRIKSSVVTNVSTTQAVQDVAKEFGADFYESAVGEINVVNLMKSTDSIIGGEGSGGVIFSPSHYGRDALVGIALFLSYLSDLRDAGMLASVSEMKSTLPSYYMYKEKVVIPKLQNFEEKWNHFKKDLVDELNDDMQFYNQIDGIKCYFSDGWVHIRKSNTEPVVRLIIETNSQNQTSHYKNKFVELINSYFPSS